MALKGSGLAVADKDAAAVVVGAEEEDRNTARIRPTETSNPSTKGSPVSLNRVVVSWKCTPTVMDSFAIQKPISPAK